MTIEQFLQVMGPTIGAVVGLIWYIQRREDRMWKHIGAIEKDMGGMKTNYVSRFETMHEAMHNIKTETLTAIHDLELNVRQSVHGLREDLAKFLGKMEARDHDGVH